MPLRVTVSKAFKKAKDACVHSCMLQGAAQAGDTKLLNELLRKKPSLDKKPGG